MALSPDGKIIAASGSGTQWIFLIDVQTGKLLSQFSGHLAPIHGLAFAPGGRYLASCSADTTALIWDVETLLKVEN